MEFITCFRSVPSSATSPAIGGTVWACEVCNDPRIDAMYPHHIWVEIEVAVAKKGKYVTSEDGGTHTFGEEDGWYSFPTKFIMKWRKVGEDKWKPGQGWKSYQRFYVSKSNHQQEDAQKASDLLKLYGINDDIPELIL